MNLTERDLNLSKGGKEEDLLGSWGVVIDTVKAVTLKRRERAGNLLQITVNTGVKSGPKELQSLLSTLKAKNQIDRLFVDLVSSSLEDCKAQGNEMLADILKYTKTYLGVLNSTTNNNNNTANNSNSNSKTTAAAAPKAGPVSNSPAAPLSSSSSGLPKPPVTSKIGGSGPTSSSSSSSSSSVASSGTSSGTKTSSNELPPSSPAEEEGNITSDNTSATSSKEEEGALIVAGLLLQEMLRTSAGDATALRTEVIQHCITGEIEEVHFMRVLEDNIAGCRAANYVNKLKVLEFIKSVVKKQLEDPYGVSGSASASGGVKHFGSSSTTTGGAGVVNSTHHAPQFVDDVNNPSSSGSSRGSKRQYTEYSGSNQSHIEVTMLPDVEKEFINVREASAALRGQALSGGAAAAGATQVSSAPAATPNPSKINNKKKSSKSAGKKHIARMAEAASKHLEEHGWAVLDQLLPLDLVQRVRVESGLFRKSYEHSEIWVGKQADVGAQLSVPSVRGDKVSMCKYVEISWIVGILEFSCSLYYVEYQECGMTLCMCIYVADVMRFSLPALFGVIYAFTLYIFCFSVFTLFFRYCGCVAGTAPRLPRGCPAQYVLSARSSPASWKSKHRRRYGGLQPCAS